MSLATVQRPTRPFAFRLLPEPDWADLDCLPDRTIAQTREWCHFIAESQGGRPVVLEILQEDRPVGWFTGVIVRRLGLNLLGSPFPGWSTSYMGFNLMEGVDRKEVLPRFFDFAFRQLRCAHLELMDRRLDRSTVRSLGLKHTMLRGFEIDLTQDEDQLFASMESACRRCIRKAEKSGVTVEVSRDEQFAFEYYDQLKEVFGRQGLVPTYSVERVRMLIRHLLPTGRLLLLRARDGTGRCIATGVFPAFNDTAHFWGGASCQEHRHLRPNEAIQWFALRYWKREGIARYDMGGGGDYKEKYGGKEIAVPWIQHSRNQAISMLRHGARWAFSLRQRLRGLSSALAWTLTVPLQFATF